MDLHEKSNKEIEEIRRDAEKAGIDTGPQTAEEFEEEMGAIEKMIEGNRGMKGNNKGRGNSPAR